MTNSKSPNFKMSFCVPCNQEKSVPFLSSYNNNTVWWSLIFVPLYAFCCSPIVPLVYILLPLRPCRLYFRLCLWLPERLAQLWGYQIASVLFSWIELLKRGAAEEAQMLFWSSGGQTAVRYAREGARETQRRQREHRSAGSGCNPSRVNTSYVLKAPCRSNRLWYPASFLFCSLLW